MTYTYSVKSSAVVGIFAFFLSLQPMGLAFAQTAPNAPLPPPPPAAKEGPIAPTAPLTAGKGSAKNSSTATAAVIAAEKAAAKKKAQEEERRKAEAERRVQKAKESKTSSSAAPYDENAEPAAPAVTFSKRNSPPKSAPAAKSTEVTGQESAATTKATANVEPADAIEKIIQGNEAVSKVKALNDKCCDFENVYSRDVDNSGVASLGVRTKFEAKVSNDEGILQEPMTGENKLGSRSYMCGTRPGNYDVCIFDGEVTVGKIKFANKGPNKVVGKAAEGRMRDWMFNFEGKNRQDISFTVSDSVDGSESHSRESHMMLFPRKYLPNIRIEGQKQIVTLPTGETVTYDAITKEVIGGVLAEKPLGQGPGSVTYNGNGLLLRVDGKQDPRQGKAGTMAIVSKGSKTCKVPVKSLWPDQSESSALHFKFSSDQAFNEFLKSTPGCPTLD